MGKVRVIGGQWRGRKLPVADLPGLRPTPDRVRETLFNWLQGHVSGARCLDLFAGSGALGFEAGSRGAGTVTLVERDPGAVGTLREASDLVGATGFEVIEGDALSWLKQCTAAFDIVFLDPPFGTGKVGPVIDLLAQQGLLNDQAYVYIETGVDENLPGLPPGWRVVREKTSGQVRYRLIAVDGRQAVADGSA